DEERADELRIRIQDGVEIVSGLEGLVRIATSSEVDLVISAIVGGVGLIPVIEAIKAKKTVAIANKEPLVMAGKLIMDLAKEKGVKILPIDSEHSGIFQCLEGHSLEKVQRIILTASGGPLLRRPIEDLKEITPQEAINHPRWQMGRKISVDSATLMNKGLEIIEAHYLFGVEVKRISVLIHPESLVHSLVEFVDGSVLAQLSIPDMRLPISYALSYPERQLNEFPKLNLAKIGQLNFEEPDLERFPCLNLALKAAEIGGTMPAVLSAANEVAVDLFLKNRIGFMEIPALIEKTMEKHEVVINPDLDRILWSDAWAREVTGKK
ncbi:TPA: 1-deoxy-D-xylulose-5-phosphate reductoisomerase, partial [bacterium]|nr:1-deoxy-D-xylulose-5-phosphate reductoisomerase [bacterium]